MDPQNRRREPAGLQRGHGSVDQCSTRSGTPVVRVDVDGVQLPDLSVRVAAGWANERETDDLVVDGRHKSCGSCPRRILQAGTPHRCSVRFGQGVEVLIRHEPAGVGGLPGPNVHTAKFVCVADLRGADLERHAATVLNTARCTATPIDIDRMPINRSGGRHDAQSPPTHNTHSVIRLTPVRRHPADSAHPSVLVDLVAQGPG